MTSMETGDSIKETCYVNVDTILIEQLGQFGRFQIWTIILAAITALLSSWATNEYVFTAARIPSRCHIPECDLELPEFTPTWLLNAVPGTSLDSFESCQRFANASPVPAHIEGVCPGAWFDRDRLERCKRSLYNNTDTVVFEFDLGCDDLRRSFIGSIVVCGMMVSMPLTGFISDRWGRRTALVFNVISAAWLGIARYSANSYFTFTLLEFLQNVVGGGTFTAAQIIAMEVVGPNYRIYGTVICSSFFAVGLVILGALAWLVPNWRTLTLILFIPPLLVISYLWIMTESSRWYISKGRYADCEKVLRKIATVNNKQISESSLKSLKETAENEKRAHSEAQTQKEAEPWLLVVLFKHKRVLLRCLVGPLWWITATFVYYGLLINAVNISGNRYFNYMAVAAAQIPGFWISLLLVNKIGRRYVLTGGFWICATCQIMYIYLPKDNYIISLSVYLGATMCSAGVFTTLYVYTAELFPTQCRHRLFGVCSMVGRLGSILAPFTPALGAAIWDELPFALIAGCAGVAGALVLLTPETRGVDFTDTMQEAEDLGQRKP